MYFLPFPSSVAWDPFTLTNLVPPKLWAKGGRRVPGTIWEGRMRRQNLNLKSGAPAGKMSIAIFLRCTFHDYLQFRRFHFTSENFYACLQEWRYFQCSDSPNQEPKNQTKLSHKTPRSTQCCQGRKLISRAPNQSKSTEFAPSTQDRTRNDSLSK